MADVVYDQFGIPRKLSHLNAVERLEKLKKKNGSNPWPVIDECINIWQSTNPREYRSFLVEVEDMRETRADKVYAQSDPRKDTRHGGTLRYTMDIPDKPMKMIRALYEPDELQMDRKFFQEFARRYPTMKVAEKQ